MNYVYYFEDFESNIIYVGKTKDLNRRMKEHFTKGHLPAECYSNINKIYAAEVNDSKYDTEICETLLINEYKPKYNSEKKFFEQKDKTSFKLLDLEFKRIYYDFEKNKISKSPIKYKCFENISQKDKVNALIDYNITILNKRQEFVKRIYNNVNNIEDLFNDIEMIYNAVKQNFIEDCSSLDMPIKEDFDVYDIYVGFDKELLNSFKISHEKVLKIFECGFIFRLDDNHFGVPLLRPQLLEKLNKKYSL